MSFWPASFSRAFGSLWRFVRRAPHLGTWAALLGLAVIVFLRMNDWHLRFAMTDEDLDLIVIPDDALSERLSLISYGLSCVLPYLKVGALLGGILLHLALLRALPNLEKMVRPAWGAGIYAATWFISTDVAERLRYAQLTINGEPVSVTAYVVKLGMILMVCLIPPLGLHYYVRCKLLDRYTLRSFLQPLLFCFIAIAAIMILIDMTGNLRDFQEADVKFGAIVGFYIDLLPYIFEYVAPASLLLAMLYSLTRMSRSNEIVSMLGAGRSIMQILKPVFVVALGTTALSMAAGYYWAPRAEGNREAIMRALNKKESGSIMAESLMFRNKDTHRTWYAGSFPFNLRDDKLRNVEVRQEDGNGHLQRTWIARSANWWPNGLWRFYDGIEMTYVQGEAMPRQTLFQGQDGGPTKMDVTAFSETPWSIVSSALVPDYLSVPELVSYLTAHEGGGTEKLLSFQTNLWQRFAKPWQCLILALVAAPLGIAYSRRGVLGGVAGAIFIFLGLMFLNEFSLSLGKGGHLPPWLAVWIPHLVFGTIAAVLLYYRTTNKDLPKLSFKGFKRAQIARPRNRSSGAAA
ncbi:MAG: LptF/LptG family permease [Verrucomicrobiaceae bacterium]|nr:LptF/LptG family permease [Verrucomicrobiaceae bacterium]